MGKSKRQQFIDLAKKGGTRQDFIDLAEELGTGGNTEDDVVVPIEPPAQPKPQEKAKGGRIGLYANINRRKKLGISRPKSKSTISKEAYSNMKSGFTKKAKGGLIRGKPKVAMRGWK